MPDEHASTADSDETTSATDPTGLEEPPVSDPADTDGPLATDDPSPSSDEAPSFRVFTTRLSGPGVLVGLLFFAFSLFESLLPRTGLFQGLASGITMMIGYGIGAFGQWVWTWLVFVFVVLSVLGGRESSE